MDLQRETLLSVVDKFGAFFAEGNIENINIDLLTDNFEAFVFSSAGRKPVQHFTGPQGFLDYTKMSVY